MVSEEQDIRRIHSTWIDAVNAADVAVLLSLMTDDVVFLNPGQAPFGRDDFPAGFSSAHRQFQVRRVSEIDDVAVVGDVGYTVCRDALSLISRADGTTMQFVGSRLAIYRRQTDGRWLLSRDAHTLLPKALGKAGS